MSENPLIIYPIWSYSPVLFAQANGNADITVPANKRWIVQAWTYRQSVSGEAHLGLLVNAAGTAYEMSAFKAALANAISEFMPMGSHLELTAGMKLRVDLGAATGHHQVSYIEYDF